MSDSQRSHLQSRIVLTRLLCPLHGRFPTGVHLFVLAILLCSATSASAQIDPATFRVEHISLKDGLSQNTVNHIFQDKTGFMWFATEDGLNRYDGHSFITYRHDPANSTSLSHRQVTAIIEDDAGDLWLGTKDGLNVYHRATDAFTRIKECPTNCPGDEILSLYQEDNTVLWVGTAGGLKRYDIKQKRFTLHAAAPQNPEEPDQDDILALHKDFAGTLWVGTPAGLKAFNKKSKTFTYHEGVPGRVRIIVRDAHDVLWVGTTEGLHQLDVNGNLIATYNHEPDNPGSLSHNDVRAIFQDKNHTLWIGTEDGLNVFDRTTNSFLVLKNCLVDPKSLSKNAIRSIYQDRTGVLWIGTHRGGLNKRSRISAQITHYYEQHCGSTRLSNSDVWAIHQDNSGAFWLGTQNGLHYLDPATGEVTVYRNDPRNPESLSNNTVRSIIEDSAGAIWIGTSGGLHKYEGDDTFTLYTSELGEANNTITAILEDSRGRLWMGTRNGLNRFNRETETFTRYGEDRIRALLEDSRGVIWYGTAGEGLVCFDPDSTREEKHYRTSNNRPTGVSNNDVFTLYEDRAGTLWLGTAGGLNKFDRATETFTHYTTQNSGLPNNLIYGFLEDDQGHLWMGTNYGIAYFDPINENFRNYTEYDGIQSNEFNLGAFLRGAEGTFYMGGINGFNVFNPDDLLETDMTPPSVVLTAVRRLNETIKPSAETDSPLSENITYAETLKLSYRDEVFSINLAVLDFTNPEGNRYSYMLEGFDEAWIALPAQGRTVTYTNVPPGSYTFRARGANADGMWNDRGPNLLTISISLPWYKKPLIWLSAIIGFLSIVAWVARSEVRGRRYSKYLMIQAELQERDYVREQIHRGPMHDIGTVEMDIQAKINESRNRDGAPRIDRAWLAHIRSQLNKANVSMRGIISHSMAGKGAFHGDLRAEIEQWTTYHQGFSDLKIKVDQWEIIRHLRGETKLALLKICKEGIFNAYSHGRASVVRIRMRTDEKELLLEIEDDGCGFDVPETILETVYEWQLGLPVRRARKNAIKGRERPLRGTRLLLRVKKLAEHFGLTYIHEWAKSFGGRAYIQSIPGQGTLITIRVRRTYFQKVVDFLLGSITGRRTTRISKTEWMPSGF